MKQTFLFLAAGMLLASRVSAQIPAPLREGFNVLSVAATGGSSSNPLGVASATQWLESASVLGAAGGALQIAGGASSQTVIGRFNATPITLAAANDTATVSFDFSVSGPASVTDGLRFALFNSGGVAPAVNSSGLVGNSDSTWDNYSGYMATLNPAGGSAFTLYKRQPGAAQPVLMQNASAFSILATASGQALAAGNQYHAVLALERQTSGAIALTATITGGGLGAAGYTVVTATPDSTPTAYAFDTLAFMIGAGGASNWNVQHLTVALDGVTFFNDAFTSAQVVSSPSAAVPAGVTSVVPWYESAAVLGLAGGTLTVADGHGGTTQMEIGYFNPVTLGKAGDVATVSFDFTVQSPTAVNAGLRFALFNSGRLFPTVSSSGFISNSEPNFEAYQGYMIGINPAGTGRFFLYKRTSTTQQSLMLDMPGFTALLNETGQALTAGTVYHGAMSFTRNSDGSVSIASTVTAGGGSTTVYSVSGSDAAASNYTFDSFGFMITGAAVSQLTLDNIDVMTSAPSLGSGDGQLALQLGASGNITTVTAAGQVLPLTAAAGGLSLASPAGSPLALSQTITYPAGSIVVTNASPVATANVAYTGCATYLEVDAAIAATGGVDLPFQATFTLPIDAATSSWIWYNDISHDPSNYLPPTQTVTTSGTLYANLATATGQNPSGLDRSGNPMVYHGATVVNGWSENAINAEQASVYPLGTLVNSTGTVALNVAVPLNAPRLVRIAYAPGTGLTATFDLGVSSSATKLQGTANFSLIFYCSDPASGMRGGLAKYYSIYPGFFNKPSGDPEGAWHVGWPTVTGPLVGWDTTGTVTAPTDPALPSDYGLGLNQVWLGEVLTQDNWYYNTSPRIVWDNQVGVPAMDHENWFYLKVDSGGDSSIIQQTQAQSILDGQSMGSYAAPVGLSPENSAAHGTDDLAKMEAESIAAAASVAVGSPASGSQWQYTYETSNQNRLLDFFVNNETANGPDGSGNSQDWNQVTIPWQAVRSVNEAADATQVGVSGSPPSGYLTGMLMDGVAGVTRGVTIPGWNAIYDYNTAHWAAASMPLTYDHVDPNHGVAELLAFPNYVALRNFAAEAHSLGLVAAGNMLSPAGRPGGWFGADVIDYWGVEGSLTAVAAKDGTSGGHAKTSVDQLALWKRALAWQRPLSTLESTPLAGNGATSNPGPANSVGPVVGYLPGGPIALAAGDEATLDFDFTVAAPIARTNGLRFGLLNSGSTAAYPSGVLFPSTGSTSGLISDGSVSIDVSAAPPTSATNVPWGGYTGYVTMFSPVSTGTYNPFVIEERNPGVRQSLLFYPTTTLGEPPNLTSYVYIYNQLASAAQDQSLSAGTVYHANLTILRNADGSLNVTTSLTGSDITGYTAGASVASTDPGVTYAFDTVAFLLDCTTVGSWSVANVTVAKNGVAALDDTFSSATVQPTGSVPMGVSSAAHWLESSPSVLSLGTVGSSVALMIAPPTADDLAYYTADLNQCLFYGIYPGFAAPGGAVSTIYTTTIRNAFKTYMPIIKSLSQAGWRPVTDAASSVAGVWLERFGDLSTGTTYLTVRNSTSTAAAVNITLFPQDGTLYSGVPTIYDLIDGTDVSSVSLDSNGNPVFSLSVPAMTSMALQITPP